jgi:hypothetical protein
LVAGGVEWGGVVFLPEGLVSFVLQFFIDGTSLVIGWVVSITEDAPDSARSLFT